MEKKKEKKRNQKKEKRGLHTLKDIPGLWNKAVVILWLPCPSKTLLPAHPASQMLRRIRTQFHSMASMSCLHRQAVCPNMAHRACPSSLVQPFCSLSHSRSEAAAQAYARIACHTHRHTHTQITRSTHAHICSYGPLCRSLTTLWRRCFVLRSPTPKRTQTSVGTWQILG